LGRKGKTLFFQKERWGKKYGLFSPKHDSTSSQMPRHGMGVEFDP
jgi:hypothetical protein